MPSMPGMNADVFWGDPNKPPPDWRDHPIPDASEDDEDSDDATPERKAWVYGVSGVDPSIWDEEEEDGGDGDDSSSITDATESTNESLSSRSASLLTEAVDKVFSEIYP